MNVFYSHRTLVPFVFGLVAVISAGDQARAEDWTISSAEEWKESVATSQGVTIAEGMVSPDGKSASLTTKLKPYPQKRAAKMLVIDQSPIWQNWNPIANIGPANLQDAPVLLTVGPRDYWIFGRYGRPRRAAKENTAKFRPQAITLEGYDMPLQTTPFPNQFNAPGGLKLGRGGNS